MIWESIVFMFWMCLGTFQFIASWARLRGMSFFNVRSWGYTFGAAMIIGAFCWFFTSIELSEGGPKGQHDDQLMSFSLGIFGALLVTWLVASIIKRKPSQHRESQDEAMGIEVFRDKTFFEIVRAHLSREER